MHLQALKQTVDDMSGLPVSDGISFIHCPLSSSSMLLMVLCSMGPGWVAVLHT